MARSRNVSGDALRPHRAVAILAVLVLAALLRLWGLATEPVWLDEACSVELSRGTTAKVLRMSAHDAHPPGYPLAFRGWRAVLGDSAAAIRGYSLLWSLVGIAATAALAAALGVNGWLAALLLAVDPLDVYFAQEARPYAQAAALGVLASLCLVRWLAAARHSGSAWSPWLGGYAVAAAGLLYSHTLGVFLLVAHGLAIAVIAVRRRSPVLTLAFASAAAGCALLYLPWLLYLGRLGVGLGGTGVLGWIPPPRPFDAVAWLGVVLWCGASRLGDPAHHAIQAGAAVVWLAVVVVLVTRRAPSTGRGWPLAAWFAMGPVLAALATSALVRPLLYPSRFAVLVAPYALVVLAAALSSIRGARLPRLLMVLAVGALAAGTVRQVTVVTKSGLDAFAARFRAGLAPEVVVFLPNHQRRTASYLLGDAIRGRVATAAEALQTGREGPPRCLWLVVEQGYRRRASPAQRRQLDEVLALGAHHEIGTFDGVTVWEVVP